MQGKVGKGVCLKGCSGSLAEFFTLQLKETYEAIMKIKTYSGWGPWSDEHGAGITALTADVWDRFVVKTKAAKPFRNSGWIYLDQMEQIMPYKPKGTHVFRPSGVASQVEPADENQSQDWDTDQIDKDMAMNSVEIEHRTPEPISDESDIEVSITYFGSTAY